MSRSRRVLGIGRMTYPDFHLLQAKESQFQPQFLGVYYGGKIKVAKIYYIDIFVYIYKILIFMNLFDVHVNRMPVDARIEDIRYYPGKFFNASLDKASRDNERCAYALKADDGDFVMVQIAGLIARRIVSYAEPGDMGKKGERIGMIKLGSRVDLYLPPNYAPRVVVGQKVFAGQSIVAVRRQPCSALPPEDRKSSPSPKNLSAKSSGIKAPAL